MPTAQTSILQRSIVDGRRSMRRRLTEAVMAHWTARAGSSDEVRAATELAHQEGDSGGGAGALHGEGHRQEHDVRRHLHGAHRGLWAGGVCVAPAAGCVEPRVACVRAPPSSPSVSLHRLYHFVSYRLVHRVSHKSSPCLLSLSPPVSAHTGMRWWRAPVRRARGW
jgi:hypothetical protein